MTVQVQSVTFAEQFIAIQYMDLPTDVRDQGRVAMLKQVELSLSHPDYRQDAKKLHNRVVDLLEDALENWRESEPYDPRADDDEDDDRGMGER